MTNCRIVAETIADQMGGLSRLNMFLGLKAAQTVTPVPGILGGLVLKWKVKGAKDGINVLKVTLNGLDLYDLEFSRQWGSSFKVKRVINNVYCDQLIDMFESTTNLCLRF